MDKPSAETGAQVSVARRRLKMLLYTVVGISALSIVGGGGYLAFKKISETISDASELASTTSMLSSQTSILSTKTTPISHILTTTQTTVSRAVSPNPTQSIIPKSTEHTTAVDNATTSPTQAINPTSTEQTTTVEKAASSLIKSTTLTSTEQSSITDKATSGPPQLCSTRPIAALSLDSSSISSDPCLGESSVMCSNGSEIDSIPKYCECNADGIWTIIQKRFDGSVNFYRNWTEFKEGFGDLNCEYWLGNDAIHQITSSANYTLKIYLTDWDNVTVYAMYNTFRIADEADGYRLTIGGYSGNAGDSMTTYHDGQMFSTKDRENDSSQYVDLAEFFTGAWWYGFTADSSLNGQYHFGPDESGGYGIMWVRYGKSSYYSMKETKMLIKAN